MVNESNKLKEMIKGHLEINRKVRKIHYGLLEKDFDNVIEYIEVIKKYLSINCSRDDLFDDINEMSDYLSGNMKKDKYIIDRLKQLEDVDKDFESII